MNVKKGTSEFWVLTRGDCIVRTLWVEQSPSFLYDKEHSNKALRSKGDQKADTTVHNFVMTVISFHEISNMEND
jgi:hypothetical protein